MFNQYVQKYNFLLEQWLEVKLPNHGHQYVDYPDSKVHGASMGPTWGRQEPGEAHGGTMSFAIWVGLRLMLRRELASNFV